MQVPQAIAKYAGKIYPGDVILANDPFTSGTHLNDVALISPDLLAQQARDVRVQPCALGRRRRDDARQRVRPDQGHLPGRRAHPDPQDPRSGQAERGGRTTSCSATCASRATAAAISCRRSRPRKCGSERVLGLVDKFGHDKIVQCMDMILDRSEQRMRQQIARLPKGTYRFKDYLDSDGHSGEPIPICVKVEVKGRSVEVDFAGSAPAASRSHQREPRDDVHGRVRGDEGVARSRRATSTRARSARSASWCPKEVCSMRLIPRRWAASWKCCAGSSPR